MFSEFNVILKVDLVFKGATEREKLWLRQQEKIYIWIFKDFHQWFDKTLIFLNY